jgi:RHS repeat-associated protein
MNSCAASIRLFFCCFTLLVGTRGVCAETAMPEGMIGWWYYTGINGTPQYTADPVTACTLTAQNHGAAKLLGMRAMNGTNAPMLECKYSLLNIPNKEAWYGQASLFCTTGYLARWPGVCVKRDEPPAPASCQTGTGLPGEVKANPVQLASGSKVQTEIDLVGGRSDLLKVARTYRSLRQSGRGQSAGFGWSFSFDRDFTVDPNSGVPGIPNVSGSFGDGSAFAFAARSNGEFVSRYDKRVSLKAISPGYDDWILTNIDGQLDRYKKIDGVYRMVSSHDAAGGSATYLYNADEQLTRITDADGRSVDITWRDGVVESIDGPESSVRYSYEQAAVPGQANIVGMARLEAVHFHGKDGALVSSRRYQYEHEHQRYLLTGITDENNVRFATYAYNGAGQALLSEHAGGAGRYSFAYPSDLTRRITDPLGTERVVGLTYPSDGRGRIASESQPAGAGCDAGASAFEYTSSGDLASSTDFNGQKTCFAADAARGLQTRRIEGLPSGASCPVAANPIISKTARMVSTQWHPDWPLKSGVAEANRMTTYVYHGQRGADGQVANCAPATTLPHGKPLALLCRKTVQATSDDNGALAFAAAKTGTARVWQYNYNSSGQLVTRTGPAGAAGNSDVLRLAYYTDTTANYTKGDLASATNGAGEVTQFLAYSKDGLATDVKQADGQLITFEYGPRRRVTVRTVQDGHGGIQRTSYQYDDAGQLIRTSAPDGAVIEYGYDAAHRLTDLRDGAGNTVHFALDNMGNVVKQEVRGTGGELVSTAKRSYDALNRLQKEQRDDQDAGTSYLYDRNGNLTAAIDPLGRKTTQVFDGFDRVMTQILPPPTPGAAAPVIGYGYSHHALLSVTDPRKLTTRYSVDGLGQETSIVSPDTGTTSTSYDGAGNPSVSADAAGRKTTYRFDAASRLTQLGNSFFEYGKDGSGATGRLTKMSDASGETSYVYDGFGRLLKKVQLVGSGSSAKAFTTAYTYGSSGSSVGHVTSLTYPSGNRIEYAYGTDGRVKSLVLHGPGAGPVTILRDIRYVPFGMVRGWTWGNSSTASPNIYERKLDLEGRIVSYPLGHPTNNGTVRTLSYDAAGRITATKHSGGTGAALLDQRYGYDGLDRLTAFDSASTSQRFQYDANGNRTRATFGANSYINAISAASNRLSSTSGPAPAKQNSFDATGNVTSDGTVQYKYGSDGRLDAAVRGAVTTNYLYNGVGQRVAKINTAGVTVHYVYDESGRLLGEYDGAGKAVQETVYLGDNPIAVLKPPVAGSKALSTSVYYAYTDHVQTPRVLTGAIDNKVVWRWDNADPFGLDQPVEYPTSLGTFTYNPRFPGQLFDRETSNHYNYFRDYDPQTGRYLQSDPIGLTGGINTYGYVNGNPITFVDPKGLTAVGALCFIPGVGWASCAAVAVGAGTIGCLMSPACSKAVRDAAQAASDACFNTAQAAKNWMENRAKNPPDIGPPGGWIQGPRRGRQYGPDGRPALDIDKPHQGNEQDHAHEWPDGVREEPGRPVSPLPKPKPPGKYRTMSH